MTTDELRVLAENALKTARCCLERDGGVHPMFLVGMSDTVKIIPVPGDLMDSGEAKDALFGALRRLIERSGATACAIASEAWMAKVTEKGKRLNREEFQALSRQGFDAVIDQGYATREEVLVVTAQNAETVILLSQPFSRHAPLRLVTFGPVKVQQLPQAGFEGRQKMFGDLRPEKLHEHRSVMSNKFIRVI